MSYDPLAGQPLSDNPAPENFIEAGSEERTNPAVKKSHGPRRKKSDGFIDSEEEFLRIAKKNMDLIKKREDEKIREARRREEALELPLEDLNPSRVAASPPESVDGSTPSSVQWNNPSERAAAKSVKRVESRIETIKRLFPDFKCPNCGRRLYAPRAWVIRDDVKCCRSCYLSGAHRSTVNDSSHEAKRVTEHQSPFGRAIRYEVDSMVLDSLRQAMGLSVGRFVTIIGKSIPWWYQVTRNAIGTIDSQDMDIILNTCKEYGITLTSFEEDSASAGQGGEEQ